MREGNLLRGKKVDHSSKAGKTQGQLKCRMRKERMMKSSPSTRIHVKTWKVNLRPVARAGPMANPRKTQSSDKDLEVGKGDSSGNSGLGQSISTTPGVSQDVGPGGSAPLAVSTTV